MKENIEELKQRLEELYKTQQARLDVGADDLDIREAIAEVEEEIKELQDDTNVDRENSIKKDIEKVENLIKRCEECKLKECINCETEKAKRKNYQERADYYWDLIRNFKKLLEKE